MHVLSVLTGDSPSAPGGWWIASLAVLFIGLSKAGFGGGLGMLTTPLCVFAFGPKNAIGILLPLLCAGDAFSLYHYWGKWEKQNLRFLIPGVFLGVLIGVRLIGQFSAHQLNVAIGCLAVFFVLFQILRGTILSWRGAFKPNHLIGIPCGIGAGITSTFAHGAGPLVNVFLIPQQLPKEVFVGTTILVFTWINWIKMPFYIAGGIIDWSTLKRSALLFPIIPVGVWLGVSLNKRLPEKYFTRVVCTLTFLAGLDLIFR